MKVQPSSRIALGMFAALAVAGVASPALAARHHVVQRGETLVAIAHNYGCGVNALERANDVDTSLVKAGTRIVIPPCHKHAQKTATAEPRHRRSERVRVAVRDNDDGDAKAVAEPDAEVDNDSADKAEAETAPAQSISDSLDSHRHGQSIGAPWHGELRDPIKLPEGKGYLIRRPWRSFGASYVVAQVQRALNEFRERFPKIHRIAVGDISARDGGQISEHRSHQSGRDVDIGLVYTKKPANYPESFVPATSDNLDCAGTWELMKTFIESGNGARGGVLMIFLDFGVQGQIYHWAQAHGVDQEYLDKVFQYPHGHGSADGIIRHVAHHNDHFHVRYRCEAGDSNCR